MSPGRILKQARRRAGLSQRELAQRAGVPVSTVARIESGVTDPRTKTIAALLALCGEELIAIPALGRGIDRTLIRPLLALTPDERLDRAVREWRNLDELLRSRR